MKTVEEKREWETELSFLSSKISVAILWNWDHKFRMKFDGLVQRPWFCQRGSLALDFCMPNPREFLK